MIICKSIKSIQKCLMDNKLKKKRISFVPTMGSLHQGHLSLVKKAKNENSTVVVSIFINPTQFGPNEDYKNYPRNINKDIRALKKLSIDFLFIPKKNQILNHDTSKLNCPKLPVEKIMCGKSRPNYFPGVGNIVIKLFDIIKPDIVFFGEKDYQQYYFIKKIIKKIKFKTKIVLCKTIRDKDGLALSSRNVYLNKKEKYIAKNIIKILKKTRFELLKNNFSKKILNKNKKLLLKKGINKIDYFELRSNDLKITFNDRKKIRLFIAVFIGKIRLIDNLKI